MNKRITRIRLWWTGILWAIAWAVIGGAVMEGILDRHGAILDMAADARDRRFPGGAVLATVLGIVASRRRFDELSIFRFGGGVPWLV
jgi:hypothetical protein